MNELRGTLGIGNIPSASDGGKKGGVEGACVSEGRAEGEMWREAV